jgi:hypothetical protein
MENDYNKRIDFYDMVMDKGLTECLSIAEYRSILPRRPNEALSLIRRMLIKKSENIQDLTIIDRYIFPERHAADYIESLMLMTAYWSKLKSVTFVTGDVNNSLFNQYEKKFKEECPTASLFVKKSNFFHDRFWIVNRKAGLFVGTSLNGIGSKYSMADYLRKEDCDEICLELDKLGF